jgi:non-ribosomal peptide synthetase component F
LSDALGAASRREGVTLFMQLLALFATVLHRRGGQTDVRVGALVSGRDGPVTAGVVGLLLNTVVLRTDVAGDPTFRELLGRVRATTLGAFANRDVPFEWVVAELERRREDFDREALFGAMLVFETEPAPPALRGVRTAHARDVIAAIPRAAALTTLDLVLSVRVGPEGVAGQLEYDPDVVEEATALGVLAELERAAAHFVADPERRISTWMVDGGRAAV